MTSVSSIGPGFPKLSSPVGHRTTETRTNKVAASATVPGSNRGPKVPTVKFSNVDNSKEDPSTTIKKLKRKVREKNQIIHDQERKMKALQDRVNELEAKIVEMHMEALFPAPSGPPPAEPSESSSSSSSSSSFSGASSDGPSDDLNGDLTDLLLSQLDEILVDSPADNLSSSCPPFSLSIPIGSLSSSASPTSPRSSSSTAGMAGQSGSPTSPVLLRLPRRFSNLSSSSSSSSSSSDMPLTQRRTSREVPFSARTMHVLSVLHSPSPSTSSLAFSPFDSPPGSPPFDDDPPPPNPETLKIIADNSCPLVNCVGYEIEGPDSPAEDLVFFENINWYIDYFIGRRHSTVGCTETPVGPVVISILRDTERSTFLILIRTEEGETSTLLPFSKLEGPIEKITLKTMLKMVCPAVSDYKKKFKIYRGPDFEKTMIKYEVDQTAKRFKFGVMLVKEKQHREQDIFNNHEPTEDFEDFLSLLGDKVRLQGFMNYSGGLDVKNDSTGQYSMFTTWHDNEIMFHVSTMLPYVEGDEQQLERKRHIGNDIVVIVYLEPGATFKPNCISSNFIHVILGIQPTARGLDGKPDLFKLFVARQEDVQHFGPAIPEPTLLTRDRLHDYLLAKGVNAELASYRAPKLSGKLKTTRRMVLRSILTQYSQNLKKSKDKEKAHRTIL